MGRIEIALPSKIYHGIIELYLHRSLLWRRKDNQKSSKIFDDSRIPTWSWMAYSGGISFEADDCAWGWLDVIKDIQVGTNVLKAAVWRFSDSEMGIRSDGATDTQLLELKGSTKGCISFDREVKPSTIPSFIALAKANKNREDGNRYFVLFVGLNQSGRYERCGVGRIREDCELEFLGKHDIV